MKNQMVFILILWSASLFGQTYVSKTFKDTRVINTHSVETLPAHKLDIRITHRFGDIAGDNGGFATFYGLENAADVMIGADYGLTDALTIGMHRSKGAGILPDGTSGLRQLLNGIGKYRWLRQTEEAGAPVSLTTVGVVSFSTAEKVEDAETSLRSFPKFAHRLAYHAQLLAARKFSHALSLQISAGYTYRNLVAPNDENGIWNVGAAGRVQLTKVFGLILEANAPLNAGRLEEDFSLPLGIGLEIETGGHVFQVNFTNATAIMETNYIPYTTSRWRDGAFRLGFTISRLFNL